jgi:hypothetical protein
MEKKIPYYRCLTPDTPAHIAVARSIFQCSSDRTFFSSPSTVIVGKILAKSCSHFFVDSGC